MLRVIKGTNWGADKKTMLNIYTAVILSKIEYGSEAYHSASDKQLGKLQTLQNRALRIILGAVQCTEVVTLHAEAGLYPLCIRREEDK